MTTNRLEAFSDGVFAVAITLLVLQLKVPTGGHLWHQLESEWPSFAAFLVSFAVIGIIWVNHHAVIDHLATADRGVLFLNLLLLVSIVFIPFSTALLAEHLKSGANEEVAAAVYSVSMLMMSFGFGFLWTYITNPKRRELLGVELSQEQIRRTSRTFLLGNPIYALAVAISFISPSVVLVIIALLAVYYAVPWGGMRSPAVGR
jgi:TMEM175 potassium channel family protein